MKTIEKKIWTEYFDAVASGNKNFELRLADWDIEIGDTLILKDWNPKTKEYTGRQIERTVTYLIKTKGAEDWGMWPKEDIDKYGFQIIGFKPEEAKETKRVIPNIIKEVGFDFHWEEEKVWALDLPVEDIPISDLEWHFDIPFWFKQGGYYDLKPREVIENPKEHVWEYGRTMSADLTYPLDIMFWKGKWLLLDGLHRLVKAYVLGHKTVKVRKVPTDKIPLIS